MSGRPDWIDPDSWERVHPDDREWLASDPGVRRRMALLKVTEVLELLTIAWVFVSLAMLLLGVKF